MSDTSEKVESLADFVRRVRSEKRLSLKDVENNSKRKGKSISNAHVSNIENGKHANITPDKLEALAVGLGIPSETLEAVYKGKAQKDDEGCNYLRELPPDVKEDAIAMLKVLWDRHVKQQPRREFARNAVNAQPSNTVELREVLDDLRPPVVISTKRQKRR